MIVELWWFCFEDVFLIEVSFLNNSCVVLRKNLVKYHLQDSIFQQTRNSENFNYNIY